MPGRCRGMGGVNVCASEGQKTGKEKKPQRPNCRGKFLCFYSLQLESSNIQFDGPLNREKSLVLTEGKVHMFDFSVPPNEDQRLRLRSTLFRSLTVVTLGVTAQPTILSISACCVCGVQFIEESEKDASGGRREEQKYVR